MCDACAPFLMGAHDSAWVCKCENMEDAPAWVVEWGPFPQGTWHRGPGLPRALATPAAWPDPSCSANWYPARVYKKKLLHMRRGIQSPWAAGSRHAARASGGLGAAWKHAVLFGHGEAHSPCEIPLSRFFSLSRLSMGVPSALAWHARALRRPCGYVAGTVQEHSIPACMLWQMP